MARPRSKPTPPNASTEQLEALGADITYADEPQAAAGDDVDLAGDEDEPEDDDDDDEEEVEASEDDSDEEPPEAVAAPIQPGPDAAKAAIAAMRQRSLKRKDDARNKRRVKPPKLVKPTEAELAKIRAPLVRVTEAFEMKKGAGSVRFGHGKILSANQFNLDDLAAQGLKFVPYEGPRRY